MASNLANIYASLLRKYGENYMIAYAAAPTYLNNIVGASENPIKIVLVFVEDRSKIKTMNFLSPSKLNIKKATDVDLDLTGSPLKDDCEVDAIADMSLDMNLVSINPWKPEEEYHKGISADKARSIMSTEEFQKCTDAADASGSVWFLCTGADALKTLLLQYEFDRNQFTRGIISYKGMVSSHAVTSQSLLQQHFAVVGKGVRLETHIENTYNIKPNIAVKCSWSTTAMMPSLIDLSICDVTLTQTFHLSDCTSSTEHFINQLRILMTVRDDILSYKQAENSDTAKEPVYRCGITIDMNELHENINKVMTELSEIDSSSGADRDIEDVIQNAKVRRLNDLTDKLWEILKLCSSYKDLKTAFNILFQCAARCNIVNTPTNKNRLAEIITAVANRRLAIPCLSGSEPLELLLEIGLEKLYKDYEYIFIESKVCSANELKKMSVVHDNKENDSVVPNVRKSLRNAVMQDNAASMRKTLLNMDIESSGDKIQNDIIGFKNSFFDEHDTAKTLANLLQIHCTLEHLLMIHIHLNLRSVYYQVCQQLLQKSPRIVDRINESLTDEMEIQLAAHYVREHLEGKDPQSRRITMKSKNELREVKSTFYYNMENICPPNISECFNADEKEYCKENIYYNWLYRKISTVKSH